jgi:hypothetical protein
MLSVALVPTVPETGVILTPQLPPAQPLADAGRGIITIDTNSEHIIALYVISFIIFFIELICGFVKLGCLFPFD